MKPKLKLADAGNVAVPAWLALQQKGYSVRQTTAENSAQTWVAENDIVELMADGPVTLLGLAALYETRGPEWQASDEQIMDFLKRFDSAI